MTHEEAYQYCYDLNAKLIEVYSEEQMLQLDVILDHEGSIAYWMGGTDMFHEGSWIWGNSGLPVQEFIWDINRPYNDSTKNCLLWDGTYDCGHDWYCTSEFYPLCQIVI